MQEISYSKLSAIDIYKVVPLHDKTWSYFFNRYKWVIYVVKER